MRSRGFGTGCALLLLGAVALAEEGVQPYRVVGNAIPDSLTGRAGDPARGRKIAASRELGNCTLCHRLPLEGEAFFGDVGPDLSGVADRLTAGELRLRLVDPLRANPDTVMPAYYRIEGQQRVAVPYRGKPVLTAEQVEDVVAYLAGLRAPR